jgi:hypothetical protein
MNHITQKQNLDVNIKRLAAQRRLYKDAKRVVAVQLVVTAIVPLVFVATILVVPEIRAWAALAGFLIALLDAIVLDPLQKSIKGKAALIQEMFDCDVLSLPWNEFVAGSRPDPEDIANAAKRGLAKGRAGLEDWYPKAVERLSLEAARIVCQRTNCWWDGKLRRDYRAAVIVLLCLVATGAIAASLVLSLSVEDFILQFVAPLAPMFVWGIREVKRQSEASEALDRLKSRALSLWQKLTAGTMSATGGAQESRQFQDGILDRRRSNPLIFDWVYWLRRDHFEDQMTKGAEEMADEINSAETGSTD